MRMNVGRLLITLLVLLPAVTLAAAQQPPAGGPPEGRGGRGADAPPGGGGPPGGGPGQRGGGRGGRGGPALTLTTPAWPDGGEVPAKYANPQMGISPPLAWTNVPPGTQSFVLIFSDPDVAQPGTPERGPDTILHWLLVNIPGTATSLPENVPHNVATLPDGTMQFSAQGNRYIGPGAPAGGPRHHYTFELFALNAKLDITPGATPNDTRFAVMKAMSGKTLGKAVYVGLYVTPPAPAVP